MKSPFQPPAGQNCSNRLIFLLPNESLGIMGKFQTHNMFKKISINTVASVEYLPRFETLTGYTA